MDAYIGEIRPFAFGWAPENWLLCNGQLVTIMQCQVLYAVIGGLYSDSSTPSGSFNLPNLQGNALVGSGQLQLPGGHNYQIPAKGGTESVTLSQAQIPAHTHSFSGAIGGANFRVNVPADNNAYLSNFGYKAAATAANYTAATGYVASAAVQPNTVLNPLSISSVGGDPTTGATVAHENRQPFLGIGYYICAVDGVFPIKP